MSSTDPAPTKEDDVSWFSPCWAALGGLIGYALSVVAHKCRQKYRRTM